MVTCMYEGMLVLFRLENTSKIPKSHHSPSTAKVTTNPCPQVLPAALLLLGWL